MSTRTEFEAWFATVHPAPVRILFGRLIDDSRYECMETEYAWLAWKARNSALARGTGSQQDASASAWISVDERLPRHETDVLIIRLGQIRVGAIFIEHESWEEGGREIHYWDDSNDDGQGWDWCEVTHWMPLPPLPEQSQLAGPAKVGHGEQE
jgi:hypothetical protein